MKINKDSIQKSLNLWLDEFSSHNLVTWEDLPEIELYMDQVVLVLNKYLKIFSDDGSSDKSITPSMINNYVKHEVVPPPKNKKYSKKHLAILIMVCTLKQTLSISTIRSLINSKGSESEVRDMYGYFSQIRLSTTNYVSDKLSELFELESQKKTDSVDCLSYILRCAFCADVSRQLSERLISICVQPDPQSDKK